MYKSLIVKTSKTIIITDNVWETASHPHPHPHPTPHRHPS